MFACDSEQFGRQYSMKFEDDLSLQVFCCCALGGHVRFLVNQTAVMTPEKFIEIHSREIAQHTPLPEAHSMDLAPLRLVAAAKRHQETGGGKLQVSEADKDAIFRELPALSQLFRAAVPSMMTEPQFWDRCLQSRYFLNAAGHVVPSQHPEDRLFDSLPAPEQTPELSKLELKDGGDPEADLTGEFVRDRLDRRRESTNENLISRLNERSAGILTKELARAAAAMSQDAVDKRRSQLRSAAQTFEQDLAVPQPTSQSQLPLQPEAPSCLPQKRRTDERDLNQRPRQKLKLSSENAHVSESGARWVLKSSLDELLKSERLCTATEAGTTESAPAQSAQMAAAVSLLQHIWSSKCTEADLRSRLSQEATKLLSIFENQLSTDRTQALPQAMKQSLVASLRRALNLHHAIDLGENSESSSFEV